MAVGVEAGRSQRISGTARCAEQLRHLHLGFTGLVLLWRLTGTVLGPGLFLFRTRRGLHLGLATMPHPLSCGR